MSEKLGNVWADTNEAEVKLMIRQKQAHLKVARQIKQNAERDIVATLAEINELKRKVRSK